MQRTVSSWILVLSAFSLFADLSEGAPSSLPEVGELQQSDLKMRRIADAVPGAVYQYVITRDGCQRFSYISRGAPAGPPADGDDPPAVDHSSVAGSGAGVAG